MKIVYILSKHSTLSDTITHLKIPLDISYLHLNVHHCCKWFKPIKDILYAKYLMECRYKVNSVLGVLFVLTCRIIVYYPCHDHVTNIINVQYNQVKFLSTLHIKGLVQHLITSIPDKYTSLIVNKCIGTIVTINLHVFVVDID